MTDNETKDLTETDNLSPDVQDTVESIMAVKAPDEKSKDEKWIKFHLLRMFGVSTQLAAKIVGFHPNYGYKLLKKYRKDPKLRHTLEQFVNSMPDDYKMICRLRLPKVAEIEGKALDEYDKDPKLVIRQPTLLKQIKMGGGVDLSEKQKPTIPTVNIEVLKLLWGDFNTPGDVQDGEIIDD